MTYSATFVENKTIIRAFHLDVSSMLELIKSTHDVRNLTEGLLLKILGELVFSFSHRNWYHFIRHTLLNQHTQCAGRLEIYFENHGYGLSMVRSTMRNEKLGVRCIWSF